jgi:phage gpG-like protein
VQKGGKDAQYAARELLGFTDDDVNAVHDLVISHLAR